MQNPNLTDTQLALAAQQVECDLPVGGPVLQLAGMQKLAREFDRFKERLVEKDAISAQQLHDQINGRGGDVASGRVGRADAMTDAGFQIWLASGGGSFASSTYDERLAVLSRMSL